MRNSLKYVNWKDRKTIAADLKTIYSASTEEAARIALAALRATQDAKHPTIGRSWDSELGFTHALLPFPSRGPKNHLRHQRHRVAQQLIS